MLRKTYTCSELCSHLNISIYDLNGIVSEDKLKARNHRYSLVEVDDKGYLYRGVGEEYVLSTGPLTVNDENGFYFLTDDVDAFEKEYGNTPQDTTTDPLQEKKQKSTLLIYKNAFIHNGDAWEIWFNGKKLNLIKNMIGLTYIANLLLKPGEYVNVVDLCDAIQGSKGKSMLSDDDLADSLNEENMSISTMQDDGLDDQGKEEAKKLIKDLKETMDDADLPEIERIEAKNEYQRLMKTLSAQYGINPLHPQAPQKVNKNVKDDLDRAGKAIRRAFKRINKKSPELADYLEKNIKTGTQYSFTDKGTSWHISI